MILPSTDPKPVPILTVEELHDLVVPQYGVRTWRRISDWISSGYSVLVYSNHEMGHPELGRNFYLKCGPGCPVEKIPPFASALPVEPGHGMMAWRYCLDAAHPASYDVEDNS